jgi:hypothetical protein
MRWLVLAALLLACSKDEPKSTRWEDAAAALASAPASSAPKLPTGTLNKYFPKDGEGGYSRVFTADKEGYAEAKLQKDGKDVATISIADADQNPDAKSKFASATEKLSGFPVMTVGKNQTSVLVKDRFQVKCSSPTLDHEARKGIIGSFDLKGLSQ